MIVSWGELFGFHRTFVPSIVVFQPAEKCDRSMRRVIETLANGSRRITIVPPEHLHPGARSRMQYHHQQQQKSTTSRINGHHRLPLFVNASTNHNHCNNTDIRVQPFWSMVSSGSTEAGRIDRAGVAERSDIQMPARQSQRQKDFTKSRDCAHEIAKILNCPRDGVFDSTTWVKAESCIHQAVENDDFDLAFQILDRMAQDPHAVQEIRNETICFVVQEWLSAYKRYQTAARGEYTQFIHSPATVWRKIESYLLLGIHIESRTLHRILEATALVKSKKWNAPMLAEVILERMIALSQYQNPDIRPSTYTFTAVIASWEAAAGLPYPKWPHRLTLVGAPERCLALLGQLKGLYEAGWGEDLLPDKNIYRRVMNLFAHRGDGDQVEALLQELYELYQEHGHKTLLPTPSMFSLVLYAWSKSKDPGAAQRAEIILDRMLEMEKKNEFPGLKVTPFFFNIVMVCWSKQRTKKSAQKSQVIFDRMVTLSATDKSKLPISGSYAALIQTWSYSDPEKAEDALWMWKREHDLGRCEMHIDSKLFSTIIAGWCNSKDPDAPARCDKLLQYALKGNLGPAWEPQASVFNMAIDAYCQRNKNSDMERVEELLEQMKELARTSRMGPFPGPAASSYAPVIHALTRLGRAEKAEELLREYFDGPGFQLDSASASGREAKQNAITKKDLNTKTLNRVLKAWLSKAPASPEAADRAEALLLSMSDWGVKPNMASFRYVLECRKKIQSEHQGLPNDTVKVSSSQILALLDRAYKTGALSANKSTYLSTRRDLSLMAL